MSDSLHAAKPRPAVLKHFAYQHLPANLQKVSRHFFYLAERMWDELPPGEELCVALRKLLEAKDAAVRARLE